MEDDTHSFITLGALTRNVIHFLSNEKQKKQSDKNGAASAGSSATDKLVNDRDLLKRLIGNID